MKLPDPQPVQWHGRAATPGPLEAGVDVTRRQALKLMAASAALAGGACSRTPDHHIYPYVQMPEAGTSGLPVYYASAFVRDGYAHGVLIGTMEGRPTKIEGNKLHPASLGATDVYAQASVLQLWDPDRSQSVRRRLADGSTAATWEAFESAWTMRSDAWKVDQGAGLRILTDAFTSPTLHAQLAALLSRYPKAQWHRHAPLEQHTALGGSRLLYGRPLQSVVDFGNARFVLSAGADPFSHGPDSVRHASDWAALRAAAVAAGDPLPYLTALETCPGLFGARADERRAMTPAAIEASLWRIAGKLYDDLPQQATTSSPDDWERRVADALRRRPGESLIIGGDSLSESTHALIQLLNQRLGNVGHTVDLISPVIDSVEGREPATLPALIQSMRSGKVDSLLILRGNPVYDTPAAARFEEALQDVPFRVHFGLYENETAASCHWHLPETHGYEQWSDARSRDGTTSIVQPAIAPLYDTRSAHELIAILAGDDLRNGHDLLRRYWQAQSSEAPSRQRQSSFRPPSDAQQPTDQDDAGFGRFWVETLRTGVVEASASKPIPLPLPGAKAIAAMVEARAASSEGLVAVFAPDAAAGDGSFCNNAWLQELPRPFTKHSWGNAACIGPTTARSLHVATGDLVRFAAGERSIEAPVWVLDGHAENAVTLSLGLGRTRAGRVGDGVGYNAYALRPIDAGRIEVTASRTGKSLQFAVSQHELNEHGRALARTVIAGHDLEEAKPRPRPKTQRSGPPTPDAMPSLYPPRPPQPHAWAMVIDLDSCIGCNACTIACQAENNIPVVGADQVARGRDMHWIRVDNYSDVPADDNDAATQLKSATLFQPVPCMHCENAPCEVVCPVGATVHDTDGLNVQVYNRCIGTRFCSNNCPYKVRRFNFLQYGDADSEGLKLQRNPDVTVRQRGVMEKCTYCVQRISHARLTSEKSGRPIADGDIVTACQSVCPTRAIHFGDRNDADSDVVKAASSKRHYTLLDELNTRPRTTYLARVRSPARVDKT